jgi:hypothetical protein
MKITELKYTERLNTGSYQFAELTATAAIGEEDDINSSILTLKTFVNNSLKGEISKVEVKEEVKTETPVAIEEVKEAKEEKPKQTRTRKAKEEVKAVEEVKTEVVEEVKETPKTKKSKITPYGAENKAVLQAYLTKKYGEAWKNCRPRNEIIDFTSKLPGKEFLDEEGNIVESFLNEIHSFFG